MIGIRSYGVHVPFKRLSRQSIAQYWGARPLEAGERSVANWDEDTVTMAVSAGISCLKTAHERTDSITHLFFASTNYPYREKQAAGIIATAMDLPLGCLSVDSGNSLRSGSLSLKMAWDMAASGNGKEVLITAADMRIGYPGGLLEQVIGDAAASVLFGGGEVIATLDGYHGTYDYFMDYWRSWQHPFVQSWEDRFIHGEGYLRVMPEVMKGLMKKYDLTIKDFTQIVFNAPDLRNHAALAQMIGAPKEMVSDSLFDRIGNTGVAAGLISLAGALDQAKPGERILFANYGDGADAFIVTVCDAIQGFRERNGTIVAKAVKRKKELESYGKYLAYRELLETQPSARPASSFPSPPAMWRENKEKMAMTGKRCRKCGTVHYPARRICMKCREQDDFEEINLSSSRGKIFTFSVDYLAGNADRPGVYVVVDLEGGGRIQRWLTDWDEANHVRIGMDVEMVFRLEQFAGGIYHYGWKPRPVVE